MPNTIYIDISLGHLDANIDLLVSHFNFSKNIHFPNIIEITILLEIKFTLKVRELKFLNLKGNFSPIPPNMNVIFHYVVPLENFLCLCIITFNLLTNIIAIYIITHLVI